MQTAVLLRHYFYDTPVSASLTQNGVDSFQAYNITVKGQN